MAAWLAGWVLLTFCLEMFLYLHWVLFACCAVAQRKSNGGPVVDLGYAKYEGAYNTSINAISFFGIRYAQAPIGDLRWKAPQDIEQKNNYSRAGVIDASRQGSICVQGTPYWRLSNSTASKPFKPLGREDCLLLDVIISGSNDTAVPAKTGLPVMVQIHGGGYTQGNSEYYPGYFLFNQSQGQIVYVTIQYRLSAYGFLDSPEIRADGGANVGLLDQRAALNWVQRNIAAFGGDPGKVTVVGGSAGGGSVAAQMIMYGGVSDPPFRAAIAEYPWWQQYSSDSQLETQFNGLLNATGCGSLACLRSLAADDLATATQTTYTRAYQQGAYGYGNFYYGPYVDGSIIRDLPSNEFKQGHFTKVPLFLDRDGYEGYSFTNKSTATIQEENADLKKQFPSAKQSFFTRLYELYPASNFNSTFFQRQTWFGDYIIDCPTYYMATAVSDAGQKVWKMIFDAGSQQHGATHTITYNNTYGSNPRDNLTLAHIINDWFLSFTTDLDPNARSFSGVQKPYWPPYQLEASSNLTVIDVNYTDIGLRDDTLFDATPQCDFWHGQSYVVRN